MEQSLQATQDHLAVVGKNPARIWRPELLAVRILDQGYLSSAVYRLRALAAEVTRVTFEVGSQGKLGGQANVPDVEGVWFELVRNACTSFFSLGGTEY